MTHPCHTLPILQAAVAVILVLCALTRPSLGFIAPPRCAAAAAVRTKKIPSPLFGYVPDGLSPEEYEKIKQKEASDVKKKNFAMWGPRFQQSDGPPGGDWFLMRNLWTTGNPNAQKTSRDAISSTRRRVGEVWNFFQKNALGFVISLGCVEVAVVWVRLLARLKILSVPVALSNVPILQTILQSTGCAFLGRRLVRMAAAGVLTVLGILLSRSSSSSPPRTRRVAQLLSIPTVLLLWTLGSIQLRSVFPLP